MLKFNNFLRESLNDESRSHVVDMTHPDHGNTNFRIKLSRSGIHQVFTDDRQVPSRVFHNMSQQDVLKTLHNDGFVHKSIKQDDGEKSFGGLSWHSETEL